MIIYKRKRKKLVIPVGLGPNVSEITGYELQNKTVDSSTVEQTVYSDVDYYGLYSVTVRPYILDAKTVDSSTVQQVVTSDASALYQVIVNPYTLENRTQTITQNGEYSFTPEDADGLARVDISVNVADIPAVVQTKSVVYTENGEYSVEPDEGYDGLSHVDVSVNVESVSPELQGKTVDPSISQITVEPDQGYDGLSSVTISPIDSSLDPDLSPENIKKDVEIFGVIGTYEGQTINNQNKTVDSSTVLQSITADSSYTGLGTVTVNPYTTETDSSVLTQNGTYVFTPDNADAISSVTIDVSVEGQTINNQSKTVDSSTTIQYVQPDQGYTGLDYVAVNPYVLDSKTVDPSTSSQTITSGEDGLSSVTVNAVDASIDPDILPENIKLGVEILGVTGTFAGGSLGTKTVDSSTVSQTVTPDSSDYGLGSVTVNPYTLESKSDTLTANGQYTYTPTNADALSQVTIDVSVEGQPINNQNKTVNPSTSQQSITADQGYTGLGTVTFNAVTAAIDPDIVPGNIKNGVEILGVIGTYDPSCEPLLQPKRITANTTFPAVIYPDQGYDGFSEIDIDIQGVDYDCNSVISDSSVQDSSTYNVYAYIDHINIRSKMVDPVVVDASTVQQVITPARDAISQVTVNAVDASIDANILPENIRHGVTILGVTGTYTGDEPEPPQITLLEYITAGDSHTENNKIKLPCNVTNETVIQFTVNWRDDQGGAFIATTSRDFSANEWRTFGYSNRLYSDLGGGTGGNRFYVADTWSAVYHQYGTIEIGVDSSYHIYQKDVSTGTTYTSTSTTQFRSIGSDYISYIGSDYTWLREIKVYENGISNGLTYDFVAAKDTNDVPGLYDTVGGVMYYATTGSMIAGPVLS